MPRIDLALDGPAEQDWFDAVAGAGPFVWPPCRRLVVVSPHPDDETLGAGGVIATAVDRGLEVLVAAVTDGELGAPSDVRRAELRRAMTCLDPVGRIRVRRLGVADGGAVAATERIAADLHRMFGAGDLVLCPVPDDGHPDHEATSAATAAAVRAASADISLRWYPVWAWHCHDPSATTISRGQRLELDVSLLERKRQAVRCYRSQITGPNPVVPERMLARLLRTFEVLIDPAVAA